MQGKYIVPGDPMTVSTHSFTPLSTSDFLKDFSLLYYIVLSLKKQVSK